MKKFLEIIKNKWLIKGTTTLLLVLIVIACYIGLNMLVEKVNVENLDFTEKKLYSLSDETKTKLSDLNQDVTIQLINATNYRYLIDYAKKYTILNDRIKVEEIFQCSSLVAISSSACHFSLSTPLSLCPFPPFLSNRLCLLQQFFLRSIQVQSLSLQTLIPTH